MYENSFGTLWFVQFCLEFVSFGYVNLLCKWEGKTKRKLVGPDDSHKEDEEFRSATGLLQWLESYREEVEVEGGAQFEIVNIRFSRVGYEDDGERKLYYLGDPEEISFEELQKAAQEEQEEQEERIEERIAELRFLLQR